LNFIHAITWRKPPTFNPHSFDLKFLGIPKYNTVIRKLMAECEICGTYIFSSSIGCLNCENLNLGLEKRYQILDNYLNLDCSKCDDKCAKKVKDKCCEKYLKKGKHCKKCPICITNVEYGDDLFV
tara:strand:- start:726 stop:1100 length:375 start_codon:yes stop_codon:yes gene_type:complete